MRPRSPSLVVAAFCCFLSATAAPSTTGAQTAPRATAPPVGSAELRGTVVEEGGGALAGAAVAVRAAGDSSLVAGGLAGTDGTFRLRGLFPGTYALRVTRIGYAPRTIGVVVASAGQRVELGRVALARVATTIEGVNVTEAASAMTIEADRNSYRAKDVSPGAANASEVLESIPAVRVDTDGKVSLRGNENVVVQINGRPSPLRGLQLAAFLKGVPGAVIERVEVVPNPSARYDPEGMAGIVNIVFKQDADLGASGGATVNVMNAERWNATGNAGWQHGRLSLLGSYGYQVDDRGVSGVNDRERYDGSHALLSATDQDIAGRNRFQGHTLTANADFRATMRDVLSQAVVFNRRANAEDTRLMFVERDARQGVLDEYLRPRNTSGDGWLVDWTTAWKRTLEAGRHEISAEARLNYAQDADSTYLAIRNTDASPLREAETNASTADATQFTAQVDYTRPLGKTSKLETGWRSNSRWMNRDFQAMRDATGSGTFVTSDASNRLRFDEHVEAVYALISRAGRRLEAQGGLRAEYTARDFALETSRYPYDYFSLFPSAAVAYKVSDATQARLAFSRRVRRPGTPELNPFPQFFDTQNQIRGDPALRPEFTDGIDLTLTRTGKTGSLQLAPYVRRTTDIIRVEIDPEAVVNGQTVTTVSFVNLATSNSFGADVVGQRRIGRWFSGVGSVNVFRVETDGGSISSLASTAIGWATTLNGTVTLPRGVSVQTLYFYQSPFALERGRWGAAQSTTVAVRKRLRGDKAIVSLRTLDLFDTNRLIVTAGTPTIQQFTVRRPGVRGVFLGFQYATGQTPRVRTPKQEAPPPQAPSGFGRP